MTHTASNPTLLTEDAQESLYDLLEYIDLLQLGSPRVQSTDQVDPFISRYSVPESSSERELETQKVRVLRWEGLIHAQWMLALLYGLMYVACGLFSLSLPLVGRCHEPELTSEQNAESNMQLE